MSTKPHLYINSKGYYVTRHSYSGSQSFSYCARKYYLERVQGWYEKQERAASKFGIALEGGVTFWHQHKQDLEGAITHFTKLWEEHKDKEYIYSKPEKDWATMLKTGTELIKLYALRYPTFPYIVTNPKDSFQVNNNFEVFPDSKLAGIEFTSYIDILANLKKTQPQPIPLFPVEPEVGEEIIIDMKTSAKDVPALTVMDPQLRSYAWVRWQENTKRKLVAFLWFRKMGREMSKGDSVILLEDYAGFKAGTDLVVLGSDDLGAVWVTADPKVEAAINELFTDKKKATEAAKQLYIETNGKAIVESALTKQRVQFKMATITKDSADDIGRKIKKDMIDIAKATELNFFPMESGVRFPDEKCPNCSMRGICSNDDILRDQLVTIKQLDEVEFGNTSD